MFYGWEVSKRRGRLHPENRLSEKQFLASAQDRTKVVLKAVGKENSVGMADNVIEETDNYPGKDELDWGYEEGKD